MNKFRNVAFAICLLASTASADGVLTGSGDKATPQPPPVQITATEDAAEESAEDTTQDTLLNWLLSLMAAL